MGFNIINSFNVAKERDWDTLYYFIDFHETISYPGDEHRFYPWAMEVLRYLTTKKEIKLVLWTCSHNDIIEIMVTWMKEHNIHFDYINENPECENTLNGNFRDKPYYNVLLDDKAGFVGDTHWEVVKDELEKYYGEEIKWKM